MQPKQLGTVYFDSDPHGAHIYVDGQILTNPDTGEDLRTPTRALLYEGRHDFSMVLEGHEDTSGYFDVFVGTTVNVYKRLKQGVSEEGWGEPEPQIWLSQQTGDIHPGAWSSIDATMRPTLPSLHYQPYQSMSSNYEVKTMQTVKSYQSMSSTYEVKTMQTGNLNIATNPSSAKIYVDSVMKGSTPAKLTLDIGYHYIVIEKEGYFEDYNRIYIRSGENDSIDRNLFKLPYVSVPPESKMRSYIRSYFMSDQIRSMQGPTTGNVIITTYPDGGSIEMDDKMVIDIDTKELLKTPVELEVGMGSHNFIFKLPGYCDEFYTIYATPRSTQYIHRDFNIC